MTSPGCNGGMLYREDYVRGEVVRRHRIVERATWGAKTPNYARMERDWAYTGIAVHHIGDWLSKTPQAVENKHMGDNGWDDVGYHYMIGLDGTVYEGRDIRYKGSHLKMQNTGRIGILLMGDFDHQIWDRDDTLTATHLAKIRSLIATLRSFFCIDTLGGHSEYPGQGHTCPGNALLPEVVKMRATLQLAAP